MMLKKTCFYLPYLEMLLSCAPPATLINQRLAILQLTELLKQGDIYPIMAHICFFNSGNDVVVHDGKEVEAVSVEMSSVINNSLP